MINTESTNDEEKENQNTHSLTQSHLRVHYEKVHHRKSSMHRWVEYLITVVQQIIYKGQLH